MDNKKQPLVMEVERNYNLRISKEKKYQRGSLLETNEGFMYLKPTKCGESTLLFHDSIYDHMAENDFHQLLSPRKTKGGKTYFHWGKCIYQIFPLERREDTKENSFKCSEEMVKLMTDFHKSSHGFKSMPGSKVRTEWGRWIWVFRSYCRYGEMVWETLERKRNKEKFEKVFLEKFEKYFQRALESIEILEKTSYLEIVKGSMEKNELCIHNFSKKNFIKDGDGQYILASLEDVKHDILAIDLGDLILANLEEVENIKKILKISHEMNPLTADELDIIKAYVQFPQGYFRTIEKYYKNKKDVPKGYWRKKMKEVIKFEKSKEDFVNLNLPQEVKRREPIPGNG